MRWVCEASWPRSDQGQPAPLGRGSMNVHLHRPAGAIARSCPAPPLDSPPINLPSPRRDPSGRPSWHGARTRWRRDRPLRARTLAAHASSLVAGEALAARLSTADRPLPTDRAGGATGTTRRSRPRGRRSISAWIGRGCRWRPESAVSCRVSHAPGAYADAGGWPRRRCDRRPADRRAIGVGKTPIAHGLSRRLQRLGIAHCHVEGDNLDAVFPKPRDDPRGTRITESNLTALWTTYRAHGHHRLIYVNTVSVVEHELVGRAVGGEVRFVGVLLTCSDQTAASRLGRIEGDRHLPGQRMLSERAAGELEREAAPWVTRISTDERPIDDLVRELLRLTAWAHVDGARNRTRVRSLEARGPSP